MGKPNTRRLDAMIATASQKLRAVRNRETWALTASEQIRLAGHGAVVVAKATRLKSSRGSERGMAAIWAGAEDRYAAEVSAATAARTKLLAEAAGNKAMRKGRS
jgi:hypothetical protein